LRETVEVEAMSVKILNIKQSQGTSGVDPWRGRFDGKDLSTGVSVIFFVTDEIGKGPVWHVHPYDEVFIIRSGRALFTVGNDKIEAKAGDVLVGPANIPHKYESLGPGLLESTDIHLSDTIIQTDLDDPELNEK